MSLREITFDTALHRHKVHGKSAQVCRLVCGAEAGQKSGGVEASMPNQTVTEKVPENRRKEDGGNKEWLVLQV